MILSQPLQLATTVGTAVFERGFNFSPLGSSKINNGGMSLLSPASRIPCIDEFLMALAVFLVRCPMPLRMQRPRFLHLESMFFTQFGTSRCSLPMA
jgi:hypothetical protein